MDATTRGWTALVVVELAEARSALGSRLSGVGFDLSYANDGLVALDVFERCLPDLILTGRMLPRLDGIEFVRRVREFSNIPVVMIATATSASVSDCEEAMRAGADRYLELGRDLDRVASVACDLVGHRSSALDLVNRRSITTATAARSHAKRELARELQERLVECRGNIAEMARRMGKDRSTIRYHLRRLGMLDESDPVQIDAPNTATATTTPTTTPTTTNRSSGLARYELAATP